jgi:hypothetical protein
VTQPDETQDQQQPQNLDAEEAAVAAVTAAALAAWLAAVALAVLAGPGIMLLGLFAATMLWRKNVDTIIAKIAAVTGMTDLSYWDQVRGHLLAIPDEVFAQMQDVVANSVSRGDSPQATKELLRQWLDYNGSPHNWPFQAERIAVTETNAAHSAKAFQDAVEQGQTSKTWQTRHDSRVRQGHRATQGQTVPIQQAYLVDGVWPAQFPGDPQLPASMRINCRCRSKFSKKAGNR